MNQKNKSTLCFLGMIVLIAAVSFLAFVGVGDKAAGSINDIRLGLDLAGGVSITYQVVGDESPSSTDMSDTIYKLQQRAFVYSTEAEVYQEGSNRINVDIPNVSDANAILEELGTPGTLYFIAQTDKKGNTCYNRSTGALNYTIKELEENGGIVLTGNDVKTAVAGSQQNQTTNAVEYIVSLSLNDEGTTKFAEATAKAFKSRETIGIYYDGAFVSIPSVDAEITTGQAVITGMENYEKASNLASIIRIGAVPLELEEVRSNVVGAKLGESAIRTSLIAGAIGLGLIILFLICYYRIMGVAAAMALGLYAGLEILIISSFEVTLTLPGIAGVILSIGMAVDANVIIFARIREEIGSGISVGNAIRNGFHKALPAILDGNITTLIAALVLYVMGTGTIKGFAMTLGIGIALSMFTALVITQLLLNSLYHMGAQKPGLYGKTVARKPFNFVGKKGIFFAVSGAMIIGCIVMLVVNSSKGSMLNYSIDFAGGTSTTITMDSAMTLEEIDTKVKPIFESTLGIADVRANTVNDSNEIVLKTETLNQEQRESLLAALEKELSIKADQVEMENISATIGSEMRRNALISICIASVCMLLYIWIRFKDMRFGLSSVLALVHDVLVVILFYAALQWSVGTTFIACILTIVGYSINATIVIFDRIREAKKSLKSNDQLADIVNQSITSTISRSINTSLTTLVTVVILAIMGVSSIKEFAYPLIVGIVCGTYSSVCVAGNLWYVLAKKFVKKEKE